MIGDKFLTLEVYYSPERSSKLEHRVQLGVVKLNLAEYLNFDEPLTAKYLLQESKINSILSLTTMLKELPSDFEFRTELRVDDSKLNHGNPSSVTSLSKTSDPTSRSFNVPQFQRKKVFGGLDGVMNAQGSQALTLALQKHERSATETSKSQAVDQSSSEFSKEGKNQDLGTHSLENVMVDPIIANLYRRILESTWDPNLHSLLKLSPEKVVHDLFLASDHGETLEKNLEIYRSMSASYDDEATRERNVLLQESKVRDNYKSWSISWIES